MSWQNELRFFFEKEDYVQCVNLLTDGLERCSYQDEDQLLNMMYVYMYMYMLKRESNTKEQYRYLEKQIRHIYGVINKQLSGSAKALFYTAYSASIAEWVINLDLKDINEMYHQAFLLEPESKLYQYGYFQYAVEDEKKATALSKEIMKDESYMKQLKDMSVLGDGIINGMIYFMQYGEET